MLKKLLGAMAPVAALAVGLMAAPSVEAVDFGGRQITVYVPGQPGTGNDLYARAIVPFLEKHLPGNPTMLVRNIPGAGNIAGMNTFQQQAQPDGLHLVSVTLSVVSNYVFRDPNVAYDLSSLVPILVSPQGVVFYASPSLGVSGPDELPALKGQRLIYGGGNATGADLRIIYMFDLLGLDVTRVWGLSRGNARLGFERREFNINYDSTPAYLGSAIELVNSSEAVPLFTSGIFNEAGEVERDPNFPDLPHFLEAYEMIHGKPLEGVQLEVWRNLIQMGTMANKYLALPAGTPADIVDAYLVAIRAILADPAAQEAAASAFEGYPQFVGDAGRPILAEATQISPEAWEYLRTWLQQTEGVTLGG